MHLRHPDGYAAVPLCVLAVLLCILLCSFVLPNAPLTFDIRMGMLLCPFCICHANATSAVLLCITDCTPDMVCSWTRCMVGSGRYVHMRSVVLCQPRQVHKKEKLSVFSLGTPCMLAVLQGG